MNGVVECKICGSKLRPVSKAYDRQHSVKQPNWRALNVLLVLGDCTLIALQVRRQVCSRVLSARVRASGWETEIHIPFTICGW
jgi:hypothetical protein